jgi:hypothetical protein
LRFISRSHPPTTTANSTRNGWFATDRHGLCDTFINKGGSTFDPKLELAKVQCADKNSGFKDIYAKYSANFLKGDDSFFKSQFCLAYQAMGTKLQNASAVVNICD